MKFTIVLACLLVLAAAAEVKSESEKSFQVSPDQDVAESYRRGFYGGYRGYWRGRRSVEGKPENETNDDVEVDRETKDEVEVEQETTDEVEVDRNTKDEVEIDREAKEEVGVDQEAKEEVGVDQEAKDEVEVDQEANEYRRGYYGGYRTFGRGRRSAEELKNTADQEANEFRRYYYGGYHGYRRGRRSVEEMNVPVYSDQDVSEWYARRYYGRPYTYRGY
ncbi:dynein heavy chain [Daphnia sinensis]|uniref:Dynein heavy chain n=1 Tax=Daphnia sinensis TaxID=1820382 RepID=A0AAD5Q2V6_9CRUS|nr:dynein heavy chain [Daphnia sinensis]